MNTIVYFEVAGPDAEGLAAFYDTVFGWRHGPGPFPGSRSLGADSGAGLAGGFRPDPDPERVLYVQVADLDATLAAVVRGGGRVLIPPTDVPGVVHFALFEDPGGNRTGIVLEMPRAPQPGASPTERGQGERIPE